MASSTEGWLPAAPNAGWTYHDRVEVSAAAAHGSVAAFYAARHSHTSLEGWKERLGRGEIERNGELLAGDGPLAAGDRLVWRRPPWWEESVPATWAVVHDDGDLLVVDKPAGLPVLPAGGWLEHTLLRLLEQRHRRDPLGVPRPVHRLGRGTSGLLVCARQPATRRWLSARLRESTTAAAGEDGAPVCRKIYRALLEAGRLPEGFLPGAVRAIEVPIGRRPHPRLGQIWCAADGSQPGDLPARSFLRLLQRGSLEDQVEVMIASGRPHQIRIHCAALGAPLRGDPLYLPGGVVRPHALPGEGGYRLRSARLELQRPDGTWLRLQAPAVETMPG